MKKESILSGKDGGSTNGEEISYYENGNKQNTTTYVSGRPTGKTMSWYENGNLKEEGEYTGNYEIAGKHYKLNQYWDENNNHLIVDGNGIYSSVKNENYSETGKYKDGFKDGIYEGKNLKENTSFVEEYKEGKLYLEQELFPTIQKQNILKWRQDLFLKKECKIFIIL